MRLRLTAAAALALAAAGTATAAAAEPPPPAVAATRRLTLPKVTDKAFPYTVEVPADWGVRDVPNSPGGVWIGRPGAEPDKDPHMLYVRWSPASLADPQKVVASIRAGDEKASAWTAPVLEVREVGGVRGVLVQLDSGEGEAARSTLALKLPVDKGSVDFLVSARRADFVRLRPLFTQLLDSVRRAEPPAGR
jgi:hypothetical protein